MATTDANRFLGDPGFFQGQFERAMGIPTAGRSQYEQWLARQWQQPATAYSLGQARGELGIQPQTFQEYLVDRAGEPVTGIGGSYLSHLGSLGSREQRAMLENLPSYVGPTALYGALQQRYPSFIAQGLMQQGYGEPSQRAFEISPEAVEGNTFLDYLRAKYTL